MVDTGPTIEAIDARPAPIRSTASIVAKTGSTVHSNALSNDSQYTAGGWRSADIGFNTANCANTAKLDTHIA